MSKIQFISRIINSQPKVNLYSKHYEINSHCMGDQMKELENDKQ